MSEMKTPWTIAFEPSGQRWIISVASQPILLPPMHQAGQTHCNLAWLRTMACNKLWRNSTHSLEASSQSQKDWGLGNFRRLCFQSSSPFCWSSVPEYLVDGIHRGSNQPIHWWNWELGHFSHYDQRVSQMWYQDLYTGIAIHTNSLKEEAAKNYVTMRGDRSQPYVRASTHVTFITGARWPNQRRKAMITMHCCRHFQFYEREITIMHGITLKAVGGIEIGGMRKEKLHTDCLVGQITKIVSGIKC